MSNKAKKKAGEQNPTLQNRRARFDYAIQETFEAGLVLRGSEVKSLRAGKASLNEAYVVERQSELFLTGCTIAEYPGANQFNHAPKRDRKLLLRRKELNTIIGALQKDRMTAVPMRVFFNDKGLAKCVIGLAQGKKKADKRETVKDRDWQRQKQRLLKTSS